MADFNLTQIVNSVQNGDKQAFAALYSEYAKQTHFLALKLTENQQDAQKVTQDVFQTVFKKIGELNNPQSFPAWLDKITVNKCTDFLKQTDAITISDIDTQVSVEFIEETDRSLIPDKALDNEETARIIVEIVDRLPLPQRVCVYYYYYENMSVKEISEQLAVNEDTVKTRLALAQETIRKELEELEEKSGLKLYMVSPLILIPAFRIILKNTEVPGEILSNIFGHLSLSASASATTAPTATASSSLTAAAPAQAVTAGTFSVNAVVIAAITAVVVIGGVITGVVLYNQSGDTEPVSPNVTTAIQTDSYSGDTVTTNTTQNEQTTDGFSFEPDTELGGWYISGYSGNADEVIIPSTFENQPVVRIGQDVFRNNRNMQSVIIPDSIKQIDNSAFYGCSSLTSVTIPSSVLSIGEMAFMFCSSLQSVEILDGVQSIGMMAFAWCDELSQVTLPNSLTEMESLVFDRTRNLLNIELPESLSSIGSGVFQDCGESLTVTYKGNRYNTRILLTREDGTPLYDMPWEFYQAVNN